MSRVLMKPWCNTIDCRLVPALCCYIYICLKILKMPCVPARKQLQSEWYKSQTKPPKLAETLKLI